MVIDRKLDMNKFFKQDDLLSFDSLLNDIEQQATDNTDLIRRLSEYAVSIEADLSTVHQIDPISDAYGDFMRTVHEEIIGKRYSTSLEGLPVLNPDYERDWPYPWGTRSPETVALFLISYGFLIRTAGLPPNARILEVGCGMGSLTWNLARMGYRVDALDPNELQCDIVRTATRHFPAPPNVISMTLDQWLSEKSDTYKYDAVIFFESFHHIADHRQCLQHILDSHLEESGKIILAAEPIFESTCDRLPYPWGPRLDGESLRAMRRWGWLELGFTADYLKQLFDHLGLTFERAACKEALPLSQIVLGQKVLGENIAGSDDGVRYASDLSHGINLTVVGVPDFVGSYSGLGQQETWGRWSIGDKVTFRFAERLPPNFVLTLELADVFGPNVHKKLRVRAGNVEVSQQLAEIESRRSYRFEFRGVDSCVIEFLIPHPYRPKDLVELRNEDPRKIGLGFVSLIFERG